MSTDEPKPILRPPPTRVRYRVLAFLCSMAIVLYLDRVCIQQALTPMREEFGLDYTQMSYVLMAFTLAYGLFEIPTGRWGDRFGSRGVLTRIVLWWSAFTALTGCVPFLDGTMGGIPATLILLVVIRFLFGAGEAGAIPNVARILQNWFPVSERGTMQGWFQASMHVGGTIAPLLAARLIDSPLGWRGAFLLFGGLGIVWATAFYGWFRDLPGEHPAVNPAELDCIGVRAAAHAETLEPVPWQAALAHPHVWLLGLIVMAASFNSYFFFSWYSTYLRDARGVSNATAGELSALALAGATVGSLLGGIIADQIARRAVDRYLARRWFCCSVYVVAAVCLFASTQTDIAWLSALWCAVACLALFCQLPTWWACAFEVSARHTGSMFGLLNGLGVVGAMGSQYYFGAFADWRKSLGYVGRECWDPAFYLSIALFLVGGTLWLLVYPHRPVDAPADSVIT
jgi:ACS family glucarate transporter-like MFS transporter